MDEQALGFRHPNGRERLRILGVAIHTIDRHSTRMPLWGYSMAFAYLKAYLMKFDFFDEVLFEMSNHYQHESCEDILAAVLSYKPDMVLFSVYVWNFKKYQRLAREIKRVMPEVEIVLGGPEVAEDTQILLRTNPSFDMIVRGEGEHVFSEIVERRLRGGDLSDVRGITYRQGSSIHRNENSDPALLSSLDVIPSMFHPAILDWSIVRGSFAGLETQRGCNFSCGFCRYRKIGEGARFFSMDRIRAELDFLKEAGIAHLYLMDPTFNNDRKRAKAILQHILDIGLEITINAEMVPEFMDKELLELSADAGLEYLEIGVQSIDKNALKVMQRPRNGSKLEERINYSTGITRRDKKMEVIPTIIYGLPGESFKSFCDTFDFVYRLDVDGIYSFCLLVLRDTQFYRDKELHGFVYEEEPPHRLVESASFSRQAMLSAGKISCVAMATQYALRAAIREYCASQEVTPSQFFLERARIGELDDLLAYAFPIYWNEQADVLIQAVEKIRRALLERQDADAASVEEAARRAEMLIRFRANMYAGLAKSDDSYSLVPARTVDCRQGSLPGRIDRASRLPVVTT